MSVQPKATIEQESLCSLKLDLFRGDVHLTSATGFFYRNGEKFGLVTNWHVLSGRNPYTGQPIDQKTGRTPNKLKVTYYDIATRLNVTYECDAGCDDGPAKWLQHPLGQRIDVAVVRVPIGSVGSAPTLDGTPKPDREGNPIIQACSDVFIVGFPKGLQKQGLFPIWKRGTVASEPELPVDELPIILVDSITRDGMSGSPVYFSGSTYETKPAKGVARTWKIGAPIRQFIGMYSGRYGATDEVEQLHLARVWKKQAIDDVLLNGVPGNYALCL